VFRQQCPQLAALFASAGRLEKVALVAIDYAKREHRALVCNGGGDIIAPAFTVHNDAAGVVFLRDAVGACIKRHGIAPQHVCFGGEDEPAWVVNFLTTLHATGTLVLRVNARDAKDQRANNIASTDDLDLLGIAKCLISRKARLISAATMHEDEAARRTRSLRDLMRQRRRLVFTQTAAQNQTHALVDRLCPGFLDEAKSGITSFGPASLEIMSERFSAQEISRRRVESIAVVLQRSGIGAEDAVKKAAQIQALAKAALLPAPAQVPALQRSLHSSVELVRSLSAVIDDMEAAMADELSYLPAALFTTISGIGVVFAAALAAELGPHLHEPSFGSQCAYAGIVPRTAQSGGSDSAAVQGAPTRRCNRILKDYLVQAASKQQMWGPPEFKNAFKQLKADGQHAEFIIARRLLRTLRAMHRTQAIYLPPDLRTIVNASIAGQERSSVQTEALRAHYQAVFTKLCTKWVKGPDWQRFLGEDRVLGVSLRAADNLLDLGLKWPQTKAIKAKAKKKSAATKTTKRAEPSKASHTSASSRSTPLSPTPSTMSATERASPT
jgi:transposase